MKFIATHDAIDKLNSYNMTDEDVYNEFNSLKELEENKIEIDKVIFNWKNEDLIIMPIGKQTCIVIVYGEELNQSYEDLPQIEYKKNKWIVKKVM